MTINAFADTDDMIQHVKALERKNAKRDMKMLIREILETPISEGRTYSIDDVHSVSELAKLNTDVRTRIILSVANDATRGDIKAAELLFKYGGYTPAVEANVSVRLPQIINDLKPPEEDDLIDVTPPKPVLEQPKEPSEIMHGSATGTPVRTGILDEDDDEGPPMEFMLRLQKKQIGES